MCVGWTVSAILTQYDLLTSDKNSLQYKARTDAREDIIEKSNWFYIPYPGESFEQEGSQPIIMYTMYTTDTYSLNVLLYERYMLFRELF